jgi:hypothetical protein
MPFETEEELWKAMYAVRQDVLDMGMEHPMDGIGGIPTTWLGSVVKIRCRNDHVVTVKAAEYDATCTVLGTNRLMCPRCSQASFVTTPIDHDGPFRSWQALQIRKCGTIEETDE